MDDQVEKFMQGLDDEPELPTLVYEFPVLHELDTSEGLEKAGRDALMHQIFGLELMRMANRIMLRVGGKEVVLKDREGRSIDSSDSSNAR